MATHPPKLQFFFKGFPEDVRFRRHTVPESLEYARGTLYETWYRCIKISPYISDLNQLGKLRSDSLFHTNELFGDLQNTTFDTWWVDRGYVLFTENADLRRVFIRNTSHDLAIFPDTLTMVIPLTVSPATLKKQFDNLLRAHHPEYQRFDRWQHSTARKPLLASRLTSVSLNIYISVYEKWLQDTTVPQYQIGQEMGLNPRYETSPRDTPNEVREKHLQMSLTVSEYLGKAKNLVAHASEGIFPCIDNHPWVERTTRESNWRHRE
jgi:hypothetical protein